MTRPLPERVTIENAMPGMVIQWRGRPGRVEFVERHSADPDAHHVRFVLSGETSPHRLYRVQLEGSERLELSPDMETVYTWANGFQKQAESMFGGLTAANLNPAWGPGVEGGLTLQLPAAEVPYLRRMQAANPARWGNPPGEPAG